MVRNSKLIRVSEDLHTVISQVKRDGESYEEFLFRVFNWYLECWWSDETESFNEKEHELNY
jgi:hypothetical protein